MVDWKNGEDGRDTRGGGEWIRGTPGWPKLSLAVAFGSFGNLWVAEVLEDYRNEKIDIEIKINKLKENFNGECTIPESESDGINKVYVLELVPFPKWESEDFPGYRKVCVMCPFCAILQTFSNPLFDVDVDFSSSNDESFSHEDVPKEIYSNPLLMMNSISYYDRIRFTLNAESDSYRIFYIGRTKYEVSDSLVIEIFLPSPIPLRRLALLSCVLSVFVLLSRIAPDYEASRARGFVLRSLELHSLASMGIQYPKSYRLRLSLIIT
ncbi:hypothetical protein Tco_1338272 [Tanacetum coccineum]